MYIATRVAHPTLQWGGSTVDLEPAWRVPVEHEDDPKWVRTPCWGHYEGTFLITKLKTKKLRDDHSLHSRLGTSNRQSP